MEQAAQSAGINRVTLHRWEKGMAQPRLPELNALLKTLAASPVQRRQAVSLVDAPRAQALVRLDRARVGEQFGFGPMPHGGDLLCAMRLRRGWTRDEVALRIGVSSATLRRWEAAETWPSVDQLHRLCYTLAAKIEEMLALTSGQFSRYARTTEITAVALMERVEQFALTLYEPPFDLKDLELLTLRAEAWDLAARKTFGALLLARVYALIFNYLTYRDRFSEAITANKRYFDLAPEKSHDRLSRSLWMNMRLGYARSRLRVPGQTTPQQSLEELRCVLPLARGTMQESNALDKISDVLRLQGAQEEALRASEESYQAAKRTMGDERAEWTRGLLGTQLIRSGRYAEGLALLSTGGPGDWYRLVETSLWKAEASISMGEKTEAERSLTQAQTDLNTYDVTPLQPRLDMLRARLHGEHSADSPYS